MKCVTFGEIMLRLSPPGFERFFQSPVLAGDLRRRRGERRGQPGALRPRQPLRDARAGQSDRRRRGARAAGRGRQDVEFVQRGGDRASASTSRRPAPASARRPSSTIAPHASVAAVEARRVPWADVFAGARWFHVTGITPALGPSVAACTSEAVEAARRRRRARSAWTSTTGRSSGAQTGPRGDAAAGVAGRRDHRQRGGHPGLPRPRRARRRRRRGPARRRGLPARWPSGWCGSSG